MSNVGSLSEVTGPIIVQCISVLRPLLRGMHTPMRSRRLGSTVEELHAVQREGMTRTVLILSL